MTKKQSALQVAVKNAFETLIGVANPLRQHKKDELKRIFDSLVDTAQMGSRDALRSAIDAADKAIRELVGHEPSVERVMKEIKVSANLLPSDPVQEIVDSYIESLMWSSTVSAEPENPDAPEDIAADEIPLEEHDESVLRDAILVCSAFTNKCQEEGIDIFQFPTVAVGHAFALNRNGHGSGFWDKTEIFGDNANKLSDISDKFGPADTYIGDDGKLYVSDHWVYTQAQAQADAPKP